MSRALGDALEQSGPQPVGVIRTEVALWTRATGAAFLVATRERDRRADSAPTLLAMDVANILEVTLGHKATLTSDRNTSGVARNGAKFCRLLRATLLAAGANPAADLGPLMADAKALRQSMVYPYK